MSEVLALVVEDHQDSAIIAANALQAAGFRTEIAETGDAALSALEASVPAFVVLDLHIPRVRGQDILRRIRGDPRLKGAFVVVATAHADEVASVDEADRIFIKPVSFLQLRNLAREVFADLILKEAGQLSEEES